MTAWKMSFIRRQRAGYRLEAPTAAHIVPPASAS